MEYIQNITIDIFERPYYRFLYAKQYDSIARVLKVTITANGQPIPKEAGVTADFRALKPDGKSVVRAATVNSDGSVTVALSDQTLAVAGEVKADIVLLKGDAILSTATFVIRVERAPLGAELPSTNEFLELVEATQAARKATEEATSAKNSANTAAERAETAAGAAETATDSANSAAKSANDAAAKANKSASDADTATGKASTATDKANDAAKSANDAADRANAAAQGKYILYDSTGQNTNGAMHQKAVSDAIEEAVDGIEIGGRNLLRRTSIPSDYDKSWIPFNYTTISKTTIDSKDVIKIDATTT